MSNSRERFWWVDYATQSQDDDLENLTVTMKATGEVLPWKEYKEIVDNAERDGIDTSARGQLDELETYIFSRITPEDPFVDGFQEEL